MALAQRELFDRADEAGAYHDPSRFGFFSVLVKNPDGGTFQSSHRLVDMPTVLGLVDKTRDSWITQAEFIRPNRRVVNLARVGLLFADLDTYNMPWAQGRTPEQLASTVLYICHDVGLPTPSLLVFSGRGVQAKWLLETPVPRRALPRWNACQRYLIDRLADAGADPAAKDASRVLRIIETVNSKSGEICHVVHVEKGADGQPVRYSFEYLAEVLLPIARWEIEQQREQRNERRQLKLLQGSKNSGLRGFSGRQLAWDRLEDLRQLIKLRGGVQEGERMKHLFWHLNFLLLSGATHSGAMYHEAKALARELSPNWNDYRSKELMTLYAKAKQFEAGEKIEFGGKTYPPLYTPRNDTLINLFQITDEEQRKLRTLVSKGIAAERHREREKARRRAAGAVDRETYLETANAKQVQAQTLRAQGLSIRAIAQRMGISKTAVGRYVTETAERPKSVRITNGEAYGPKAPAPKGQVAQ